jgi:hypothetical protein
VTQVPASSHGLAAQATLPDGTIVAAPYSVGDHETGLLANRASGFFSPWETFDLGKPGVGYGKSTVTAAVADTETWGTSIQPVFEVEVSVDGVTWHQLYGITLTGGPVAILANFALLANPVATFAQYVTITPRFIRIHTAIADVNTGLVYAGANNPTLTCSLDYTAG